MSPTFIAFVYGAVALAGAYGIARDIRAGDTGRGAWIISLDDNPVGFCLSVCGKAAIVAFAVVGIMHVFGLSDDPIEVFRKQLAFLLEQPPHQ
jgi:hypothetical protein